VVLKNFILHIPRISALRLIKGRIFYGWWIVFLGSLITAVEGGVFYQSFTVFFLPLKRDFGVDSTTISLLYSCTRLEGGFEGPLVGHLINKFGPRTMILAGGIMAGGGLILLSTVDSFWPFFFIYIFIVSLGYNAGSFHPVTTALTNWFIQHRGVAFSCVTASISLGGMIMIPLLSHIILNLGWQAGTLIAGLIILIVALPAAIPIRRSPEALGFQPDGRPFRETPYQESRSVHSRILDSDFTVGEALRTRTYWMLTAAISLRLFVTMALNAHLIPVLVWRGIGEVTAAYLASLFAFGSVVATLAMGYMGDRWSKSLLCSLGIMPTIVALVGLTFSKTAIFIYLLLVSLAVTMGTAPLNWSLIGDLFGRRSYASLRGLMAVFFGIATFSSPIYAGWVYDRTDSYTLVLMTFSIIFLVSASFFSLIALLPPVRRLK